MTPAHRTIRRTASLNVSTKVIVKIENDYSDGHHSEREVELDAPPSRGEGSIAEMLDNWFNEVVYQETGDGHGIDFDGGSCYTATIVAGPAHFLGETYEWVD